MDVVALNNQAVSGYQAGYHREALTAFTKILLFLQSQGRRPCEEEPTDENQRLAAFAVTAMPLSDEPMSRFGSLFPFYSSPFCLLDSNNEEEDPAEMDANWRLSEKDEMLQFAVVTYNAALAHHALAIRQDSATHFRKAVKLYEVIFRAMQKSWDCSNHEEFLLLLAVCNNVGFIQSHLQNFEALNYCLGFFKDLVDFCDEEDPDLLATDEYLYFFTTALLFQGQQLALAPAA